MNITTAARLSIGSASYEPDHEEEEFDKEYETSRCCECTTVKQFTNNIDGEFFCTACKHERCSGCTEYDCDNHSILSDEGEENEEGQELWRIHDDEADDAIARAKEPNLLAFSVVELGTNDINFITVAFDKREVKDRIKNVSNDCKYLIAFEYLKPDARTIRVIWSHSEKKFTYRCEPANLKPFMLDAFNKALRTRALRTLFVKAPHIGLDAYPWFRYDIDTLFLRYERCGNRWSDAQEYVDAMKSAAQHLRAHVAAGNTPIARLRISWCQNQESPREILRFFRTIPGIETIDLEAHDHYTDAFEDPMTNHANRWQYDPSEMQHMVNSGDLNGYPFVVRLFSGDWNGGEEHMFGAKPLPGRGDDDNSDEDTDGSSNKDSDEDSNKDSDEEHDSEENGSDDGLDEENGFGEDEDDEE